MVLNEHTWQLLPLSTDDAAALTWYRRGIAALVAGAPNATSALERSVAADGAFFLAAVGLAAAQAVDGQPYVAPEPTGPVTRAERHHAEIVAAFCLGDRHRAADLRREHLIDYPADLLVVWAPNLPEGSTP